MAKFNEVVTGNIRDNTNTRTDTDVDNIKGSTPSSDNRKGGFGDNIFKDKLLADSSDGTVRGEVASTGDASRSEEAGTKRTQPNMFADRFREAEESGELAQREKEISDRQKEALKKGEEEPSVDVQDDLAPQVLINEGAAKGTDYSTTGGNPVPEAPSAPKDTSPQEGDDEFVGPIRDIKTLRRWAQQEAEAAAARAKIPEVAPVTEEMRKKIAEAVGTKSGYVPSKRSQEYLDRQSLNEAKRKQLFAQKKLDELKGQNEKPKAKRSVIAGLRNLPDTIEDLLDKPDHDKFSLTKDDLELYRVIQNGKTVGTKIHIKQNEDDPSVVRSAKEATEVTVPYRLDSVKLIDSDTLSKIESEYQKNIDEIGGTVKKILESGQHNRDVNEAESELSKTNQTISDKEEALGGDKKTKKEDYDTYELNLSYLKDAGKFEPEAPKAREVSTGRIARNLKKEDEQADSTINWLQENANVADVEVKHNRDDETVKLIKAIKDSFKKGFGVKSDEKVEVNEEHAKGYLKKNTEAAKGTIRVPGSMSRETYEGIEEYGKAENKKAREKIKAAQDKRVDIENQIQDIKAKLAKAKENDKQDEYDKSVIYDYGVQLHDLIESKKKADAEYYKLTNKDRYKNVKFKKENGNKNFNKKWNDRKKDDKKKTDDGREAKSSSRIYLKKKNQKKEQAKKAQMKSVTLHSEEFEQELINACEFFGWDPEDEAKRTLAMKAAVLYSGICIDRSGKLFGKKFSNYYLDDRVYIDSWNQMKMNMQRSGFPFLYSDTNYKIGGNFRFPMTMMPPDIVKALTQKGSLLEGWSMYAVVRRGYNEFLNNVAPAISVNAKTDQKLVMQDLFQTIAEEYGDAHLDSGITSQDYFSINEAFDPLNDYAMLFPNTEELVQNNEKCRQRALRAQKRIQSRNTKTIKGADGAYRTLRDISENCPDVFANIIKAQRAQSLMFDVTLGASSAMEHLKGNFSNSMASKMMLAYIGKSGPTAATYEIAKSKEFQDILFDAMHLLQIGGSDGLNFAISQGYVLGRGDAREYARKFLVSKGLSEKESEEYLNMSPADQAAFLKQNQGRIQGWVNKFSDFAANFATGEWVCKGGDAKRFVEFLAFNTQKDADRGGMNLTPEQMERMLMQNPQQTITQLMLRPEGVNALTMTMDSTIGGANPFTDFWDEFMSKHGMTDWVFSNFVTLFPKYGFMAIGKVMPMSHTGMYLASKGYYATKSALMKGVKSGDIHSADTHDRLDTLIGGNDSFTEGLMQNLLMDFAQLGTNAMMFLVEVGFLLLTGIQEPPEEDKKYVYEEWRLFTNLPGGGVAIKQNWYLNEFFGIIGGPAAVAAAGALAGASPDVAFKTFKSGSYEVMMNTGVSQVTKFCEWITDFDQSMIAGQIDGNSGRAIGGDYVANQILLTFAKGAIGTVEPRFIKTLYSSHFFTSQDNLAHSTSQIYNPESEDGGTMATTQIDSMYRRWTYNDPLAALVMNTISGSWWNPDSTGYLREQMPLITEIDPTSSVWQKHFSEVDGREITWDSSDEDKQIVVDRVLDAYDTYGGIQGMVNAGIVVPYVIRYYVSSYLQAQKNANWNAHYERQYSQGGFSSLEEKEASVENVQKMNAAIDQKIQEFKDSTLPYSAYKLHRYETDYWKNYYSEDENGNREYLTPDEYLLRKISGDDSVTKNYYASGDHKSGLPPYLMVDNDAASNSIAPWYNKEAGFDRDQLLSDIGDEKITFGQNKGRTLAETIGAGDGEWTPTTGSRANVSVKNPFENDYEWPKQSDPSLFTGNLGENGKNKTSNDWKNSNKSGSNGSSAGWGYTSSRRYSGGSSSRAASIYSRPASSLSADRAATMYSKNRSETKYDYLRPDFETKGSRDAYKRSDT